MPMWRDRGSSPVAPVYQLWTLLVIGFNHGLSWCVKYMAGGPPVATKPDDKAGGFRGDWRPEEARCHHSFTVVTGLSETLPVYPSHGQSRYIQHAAIVAEISPSSGTDQSGSSGFGGYQWYLTLKGRDKWLQAKLSVWCNFLSLPLIPASGTTPLRWEHVQYIPIKLHIVYALLQVIVVWYMPNSPIPFRITSSSQG